MKSTRKEKTSGEAAAGVSMDNTEGEGGKKGREKVRRPEQDSSNEAEKVRPQF